MEDLVICIQGECSMASRIEISIGIVLIRLLKLILTRLITTLLSIILTKEEIDKTQGITDVSRDNIMRN